jgi:hypothetical protein
MTDYEIRKNHAAIENAVASQRLEGLEPDPSTVAELERAARGEISVNDVLVNLHRRVAAGEFRTVLAK